MKKVCFLGELQALAQAFLHQSQTSLSGNSRSFLADEKCGLRSELRAVWTSRDRNRSGVQSHQTSAEAEQKTSGQMQKGFLAFTVISYD